jgi:hypothetical protein
MKFTETDHSAYVKPTKKTLLCVVGGAKKGPIGPKNPIVMLGKIAPPKLSRGPYARAVRTLAKSKVAYTLVPKGVEAYAIYPDPMEQSAAARALRNLPVPQKGTRYLFVMPSRSDFSRVGTRKGKPPVLYAHQLIFKAPTPVDLPEVSMELVVLNDELRKLPPLHMFEIIDSGFAAQRLKVLKVTRRSPRCQCVGLSHHPSCRYHRICL